MNKETAASIQVSAQEQEHGVISTTAANGQSVGMAGPINSTELSIQQKLGQILQVALTLAAVLVVISFIPQFRKFDPYFNQDLPGFFSYLSTLGWLGIIGAINIINLFSSFRWPLLSAGLTALTNLMAAVYVWSLASVFSNSDLRSFPTPILWEIYFGLNIASLLLASLRVSKRRWMAWVVVLALLLGAVDLFGLWTVQSAIAARQERQQTSQEYQRLFSQVIADKDLRACYLLVERYRSYLGPWYESQRQECQQKADVHTVPIVPEPTKNTNTTTVPTVFPAITDITAGYASGQVTVAWSISPTADGIVNFGPTTDYGRSLSDYAFTTHHSLSWSEQPGAVVHYALRSCTENPGSACTSTPDRTFIVH